MQFKTKSCPSCRNPLPLHTRTEELENQSLVKHILHYLEIKAARPVATLEDEGRLDVMRQPQSTLTQLKTTLGIRDEDLEIAAANVLISLLSFAFSYKVFGFP